MMRASRLARLKAWQGYGYIKFRMMRYWFRLLFIIYTFAMLRRTKRSSACGRRAQYEIRNEARCVLYGYAYPPALQAAYESRGIVRQGASCVNIARDLVTGYSNKS